MRLIILLLLGMTLSWAKIGTIAAMRGEVDVVRNSQHLAASIGLAIDAKDTIVTQARSKAQVVLLDQTVITVGPQSEFSFDAYGYPDEAEARMRAKNGFFKAVTGKIGKIAPERFSIKTKSATIGIRGTHFIGYVSDKTERIGCLKGEIFVTTSTGSYNVPAGNMILFEDGQWQVRPLAMEAFEERTGNIVGQENRVRDHYRPGMEPSLIEEETIQEQVIEKENTQDLRIDQGFSDFVN